MPVNQTKDVAWPDPKGTVQVAGTMTQEVAPQSVPSLAEQERLAAEKQKLEGK